MRVLWHKPDDADWREVRLHDIDARHALEVDPEHWSEDRPPEAPALEQPLTSEVGESTT